jgi:pseudouridine-5'-phosphate glycosidase
MNMNKKSDIFSILPQISSAIRSNQPVVAFESAVITHGLPYPTNKNLALDMENIAKNHNNTPATIALIKGKIHVGLNQAQIEDLSQSQDTHKISRRDLGAAIQKQWSGGTTVASTIIVAKTAGINVFATGGIGGVHRGSIFDISADLQELSKNQIIVVCAGAKSILDLPATLEYLETCGVPVLGYQTDKFPAFYSRESGLNVSATVDTPLEIANIFLNQKIIGLQNAILVVNPLPEGDAIPYKEMEEYINLSHESAKKDKITGSAITPYLLEKISVLSNGKTIKANLALLKNNAELACKIANEISLLTSNRLQSI